jgi:hypothetical protein
VEAEHLVPRIRQRAGDEAHVGVHGAAQQVEVQVRAGATSGVHERLGTDRSDLHAVIETAADDGSRWQGVGSQRVEPEPQRTRRVHGQPQVLRVLAL